MEDSLFRFELGKPDEDEDGRWLEASVQVDERGYTFTADLLLRLSRLGVPLICSRVFLEVGRPFSTHDLWAFLEVLTEGSLAVTGPPSMTIHCKPDLFDDLRQAVIHSAVMRDLNPQPSSADLSSDLDWLREQLKGVKKREFLSRMLKSNSSASLRRLGRMQPITPDRNWRMQPEDQEVDEGYRPPSYFGPSALAPHLLRTIKGAERRNLTQKILESDETTLPDGLAESALPADLRQAWGGIHPVNMGGEYLPDRNGRELEIARITIQSTTQDVTSVYAYQGRGRLRYRVVDEYGGDTLGERTRRTSSRPLTLGALVDFFLGAWDLMAVLEMNSLTVGSLDEALAFFKGESAYYPNFDALLRSRVNAWWADREDGSADEWSSA